jgi:hypothetical protein
MANRMVKKYKEGGEVGGPDIPEERGPVGLKYNRHLDDYRYLKDRENRAERDQLLLSEAGTGDMYMDKKTPAGAAATAAARETARRRRVALAQSLQRDTERDLDREGKRINQRRDPTRVEDNGYKKGGLIKKASGGRVRGDGCAIRGKTKGKMV